MLQQLVLILVLVLSQNFCQEVKYIEDKMQHTAGAPADLTTTLKSCSQQKKDVDAIVKQYSQPKLFSDFQTCLGTKMTSNNFIASLQLCQPTAFPGLEDQEGILKIQNTMDKLIKCLQVDSVTNKSVKSFQNCSTEQAACTKDKKVCAIEQGNFNQCILNQPKQVNVLDASRFCMPQQRATLAAAWEPLFQCIQKKFVAGINEYECKEYFPKYLGYDQKIENPCSSLMDRLFGFSNILTFQLSLIFISIIYIF